jgi:hypothetical protein
MTDELKYIKGELIELMRLGQRIAGCLEAASMGLVQAGEKIAEIQRQLQQFDNGQD